MATNHRGLRRLHLALSQALVSTRCERMVAGSILSISVTAHPTIEAMVSSRPG